MARKPKPPLDPRIEALRPYLEGVAKKLADDLFGPQGPPWGTSLTELEDVTLDVRDILSKKLLELNLERQAITPVPARPPEMQSCPSCQRSLNEPREPEPRTLETRAGQVDWDEPKDFCTRCRRAFFPSEQKSRP